MNATSFPLHGQVNFPWDWGASWLIYASWYFRFLYMLSRFIAILPLNRLSPSTYLTSSSFNTVFSRVLTAD